VALCAGIAACTSNNSPGETPGLTKAVAGAEDNKSDPVWVSQHTPRAQVAVVFIHGIFGDTLGTWTANPQTSFFSLLNADAALQGPVDIFAFGYTSRMLREASFSIDEAAKKLKERLDYHGVTQYPAIVFVAHSMGGLVTLRTLLTYRDLMPRVPLIALYATPQEGSQIAAISQYISPNPALRQMIPGDQNLYLQALDNDWKEANKVTRIPVICAYESRPTYRIKIVPRGSATRYCTEASSAIDADHISIVKPDRPGHDSVVLLVNALNRYVLGQQLTAKLELPDFQRVDDGWLFTLTGPYKQRARLVNAGRLPLRYTIAELTDPGLYVWPDDTPHTIPGGTQESMSLALAWKADKSQYQFLLRADGMAEQRVTVRVPDLPAFHREQEALTAKLTADFNAWLGSEEERRKLSLAQPGDKAVQEAIIEQARRSVATVLEGEPESLQWVVTAETLNSANWPTLAVDALRQAEAASESVVRMPSVMRTTSWVAASAGEPRVFAKYENPVVPDTWSLPIGGRLPDAVDKAQAAQLVERCKDIPALRMQCWSLKGDLAELQGDAEGAKAALEESARVRMTPAVSERLRRQTTAVAPGRAALPLGDATVNHPPQGSAVILNPAAVVVPPAISRNRAREEARRRTAPLEQ
jgi:pimeloyl-ACP methyl ester carboxylesterase